MRPHKDSCRSQLECSTCTNWLRRARARSSRVARRASLALATALAPPLDNKRPVYDRSCWAPVSASTMLSRNTWLVALGVWLALGVGTTLFLHYHLHSGGGVAHHAAVKQAAMRQVDTSGSLTPLQCPEPAPCPACVTPAAATPCVTAAGAAVPETRAANAIITARPCPALDADGQHPCSKRTAKIRAGYTQGVTPHVSALSKLVAHVCVHATAGEESATVSQSFAKTPCVSPCALCTRLPLAFTT